MLVVFGRLGGLGLFCLAGKSVVAHGLKEFLQLALGEWGGTLSYRAD